MPEDRKAPSPTVEALLARYDDLGFPRGDELWWVTVGDIVPLLAERLAQRGETLDDEQLMLLYDALRDALKAGWRERVAQAMDAFLDASAGKEAGEEDLWNKTLIGSCSTATPS